MLKVVKGCYVPCPELLEEGYENFSDATIYANVNADKIKAVFEKFITMRQEKVFFVLHLPLDLETQFSQSYNVGDEREYFFIDDLDQKQALEVLDFVAPILMEDGLSRFGFGCHASGDELFKDRFNMLSLTSMYLEKYAGFFEALAIPEVESLKSAWDTFDEEHVGRVELYTEGDIDAFALPEALGERWEIYAPELVPND